jgi:hypothetical protein
MGKNCAIIKYDHIPQQVCKAAVHTWDSPDLGQRE